MTLDAIGPGGLGGDGGTWTVAAGGVGESASGSSPLSRLSNAFQGDLPTVRPWRGHRATTSIFTVAGSTRSRSPSPRPDARSRPATTQDTQDHYETTTFTIDPTILWEDNDTWTITINGDTYTYIEQLPANDPNPEADRNVKTIAAGIAAAVIELRSRDPHISVVAGNGVLTITDTTSAPKIRSPTRSCT